MAILTRKTNKNWLLAGVEAHLDAKIKSETRSDPGWFHPSDLANPCDAALAMAFLGMEKPNDITPRVQRIFDLGNARDQGWKRYLAEAGLSVVASDEERKMRIDALRIRGECDDIVVNPETGKRYIIEIKTINDRGFTTLSGKPLDAHYIQAHCYMFGHQVWDTIYIYENKNDQNVKLIHVKFNEPTWDIIASRCRKILHQLENGYTPTHYNMAKCGFGKVCQAVNFARQTERFKEVMNG